MNEAPRHQTERRASSAVHLRWRRRARQRRRTRGPSTDLRQDPVEQHAGIQHGQQRVASGCRVAADTGCPRRPRRPRERSRRRLPAPSASIHARQRTARRGGPKPVADRGRASSPHGQGIIGKQRLAPGWSDSTRPGAVSRAPNRIDLLLSAGHPGRARPHPGHSGHAPAVLAAGKRLSVRVRSPRHQGGHLPAGGF